MADLIATKSMTYGTRRMKAGDGFEVHNRQHSRALIAIGKARLDGDAPAPADMGTLRQEYTSVAGKKPYHGWDAKTLAEKIKEAGAE